MLTLLTEMVEEQIIRSNLQISARELQSYCGSTQQLTRILSVLGLQRRARQVGPTFGELLRADLERENEAASDVSDG
jgi:hypothetical protein